MHFSPVLKGSQLQTMQPKKISLIHCTLVFAYFIVHCYSKEAILNQEKDRVNRIGHQDLDIWNSPICGTRSSKGSYNSRQNVSTTGNSSVGKWPWLAGIYFKDPSEDNQLKHAGAASIITDRHLLTVACVLTRNTSDVPQSDLLNFVVFVGSAYEKQGYLHYIQKVLIHPRHKGTNNLCRGIAVVKLINSMTFSEVIRPICLPTKDDRYFNFQGQMLPVIGWSTLSDNSSEIQVLNEVNISVQPKEFCQQYIRGSYPIDKLICGWKSKDLTIDSCSKLDNGGPLMINKNGKFTAVGLTDFGIGKRLPCGSHKVPVYFIKVAPFMRWITDAIYKSLLD